METEVKKTETISIVGFIFSFLMPLVGLILTIIGLVRAKKNESPKGFAIAGLIISIVSLIFRWFLIVLLFFALGVTSKESTKILQKGYDGFCQKAQRCEHSFGDYYNCYYEDGNVKYNLTCHKNAIKDKIKGEDSPKEDENDGYSLDEIKEIAIKYLEDRIEGEVTNSSIKELDNNMVEISLYVDDYQTIYTVNRDTLIGYDNEGMYIDLNSKLVTNNSV